MATYQFPAHRLRHTLSDSSKTPIALVACGSFSPVTYLHLRMFEMARDYIRTQTNFEVIAAYMSPVNDDYKKPGLLSACPCSMPTPTPHYLLAYMCSHVLQTIESICALLPPSRRAIGSCATLGRASSRSTNPLQSF